MEEYKDKIYEELKAWVKESRGSRIKVVAGDFNARVQTQYEGEERHIRKHTFSPHNVDIESRDISVLDNRMRMVEMLVQEDMVAMNTRFKKQEWKLFTFEE